MTRTYAGPYSNPTESWIVKPFGRGKFAIFVRSDRRPDGSTPKDRRHTSAPIFDEGGDAADWIDGVREGFEEDYDRFLDENGPELARMERYEAFRNEF